MIDREEVNSRESLGSGDSYSTASPRQGDQQEQNPVVMVPTSSLLSSDSPRLAGEDDGHARALAESEATFPPILVNRPTMRVIDGMHRLRAAVLRGEDEIRVQFVEGDEVDAFILAVEANIAHGLPLSLADRKAAAGRIINSRPRWSDRAIASTTGLSSKTVASIRRRSTVDNPQLNTRVGRDGRARPPNTAGGRRIAGQMMADDPNASLREIASATGISLGTAHDVSRRLHRGESPTLPKQRDRDQRDGQTKDDEAAIAKHKKNERALLLQSLKIDPSLRLTDAGRVLIRLLHALTIDAKNWDGLVDSVPAHCKPMVSDAARACAKTWQEFAEQLERR